MNMKINLDALKLKKDNVNHKINSGVNKFRFLPPFGAASNGSPFARWIIAWMIDPSTGKIRPVPSLRSFGEKDCAIYSFYTALEAHLVELNTKLIKEGKSQAEATEELSLLEKFVSDSKPKIDYIYNAVDNQGKLGRLSLKKTAHEGVIKLFQEYINEFNSDPTSLNSDSSEEGDSYDSGVWINIIKEGQGRYNTEYSVSFAMKKIKENGKTFEIKDTTPLPEAIVKNYNSVGYDLFDAYKKVSKEEIEYFMYWNALNFNDNNDELLEGIPGYPIKMMRNLVKSFKKDGKGEAKEEEPSQAPKKPKVSLNLSSGSSDDESDDEIDNAKAVQEVKKPIPKKNQTMLELLGDIDD